ncbi:uncharacterized protein LOC144066295 [Stigmatopora argus]
MLTCGKRSKPLPRCPTLQLDFIHDDVHKFPLVHRRALHLKVTEAEYFGLDCTAKTHSSEDAILKTRPNYCTFAVQMMPSCSIQQQVTSHNAKVSTLSSGVSPTGWKKNFKTSYFGLHIWTFALKQIKIKLCTNNYSNIYFI